MPDINEFVVVKVGHRWCAPCGCGISFLTDDTAEQAARKTIARWGGEWDCTPDGTGFRYRRKPPQSDAERVAREIYALLDYDGLTEAEFVRAAAPLIAGANAAEVKSWQDKWAMMMADRDACANRVAELEEENARLLERIAGFVRTIETLRKAWEQLRDAVKEPAGVRENSILANIAGWSTSGSFAKPGMESYLCAWSKSVLPRLEAALKEPEQPHA